MAFVVPAEIGHAPYSRPLVEYLAGHFKRVHVVAVREKLFQETLGRLLAAFGVRIWRQHGATSDFVHRPF